MMKAEKGDLLHGLGYALGRGRVSNLGYRHTGLNSWGNTCSHYDNGSGWLRWMFTQGDVIWPTPNTGIINVL
jgi:hypothetical protein